MEGSLEEYRQAALKGWVVGGQARRTRHVKRPEMIPRPIVVPTSNTEPKRYNYIFGICLLACVVAVLSMFLAFEDRTVELMKVGNTILIFPQAVAQ
jgi:hypothetical protein